MTDIQYGPLPQVMRPLLNKFYRAHHAPMRAGSAEQLWVAKNNDILAALCLKPIAQGHWLTGLFVAPTERRQHIASTLIGHAVAQISGPIWLFCHPELVAFYQRLGFQPCSVLPEPLADRLTRYSQTKSLVALAR
ncbi:N-acetyltransferase [Pseudomonas cavernicola]|uniref:N-acetyltransferase n=1 Tax=Pseudomonas cavernicola TaxID=2320866 RepID=A0A418XNF1_9PSED|nr:GNAT family N-acetyltransferase [Pseudomonas cavernicola]RJG13988.1 N-acetyltransferase [Pseudomonas cavernicola]